MNGCPNGTLYSAEADAYVTYWMEHLHKVNLNQGEI